MNTTGIFHAEQFERRRTTLAGWPARIVSYKLGNVYVCEVDNVAPGATLVRIKAGTRQEAEQEAVRKAEQMFARTRRILENATA